MRIFFCAEQTCAFFVNGMYLGAVDSFERSVEIDPADGVFCELKAPAYAPVRFCLDEDFLFSPPEGVELYFFGGAAGVHIKDFVRADPSLRVVWQQRIAGSLLTLCVQGRVVLNFENKEGFVQIPLPFAFERCEASAAGKHILLEGQDMFALIDEHGRLALLSEGKVTERGATVTAEVPFRDALAHVARCTYTDGRLTDCTILSVREPDEHTVALALLESVLAGFDPAPYLAPALAPKARLLREFLGNYSAVTLLQNNVVGLIYERKPRVYDVRDFRVSTEDGKVSNLEPVPPA